MEVQNGVRVSSTVGRRDLNKISIQMKVQGTRDIPKFVRLGALVKRFLFPTEYQAVWEAVTPWVLDAREQFMVRGSESFMLTRASITAEERPPISTRKVVVSMKEQGQVKVAFQGSTKEAAPDGRQQTLVPARPVYRMGLLWPWERLQGRVSQPGQSQGATGPSIPEGCRMSSWQTELQHRHQRRWIQ